MSSSLVETVSERIKIIEIKQRNSYLGETVSERMEGRDIQVSPYEHPCCVSP
jgi:hypothetical protein